MAKFGQPLDEFIDKTLCECLNQDEDHPVGNALEDGEGFLSSDADCELLVKVQFRQPIKLTAVVIKGTSDEESGPATVKIFQGKPDLGFEASDEEATEDLLLEPDTVGQGTPVSVRFVKYQCVQSLQLFFGENRGAEKTKIQRIQLLGEPAQKMDMKDWKPIKG